MERENKQIIWEGKQSYKVQRERAESNDQWNGIMIMGAT